MSGSQSAAPAKIRKINLRTPEVMAKVQEQVESHYRSIITERIRAGGGTLQVRDTTVLLAKQFGFCYGVERAIDLAYAARKVFFDRRLFILGEIIHNPLVNEQIATMGIKNLIGKNRGQILRTSLPKTSSLFRRLAPIWKRWRRLTNAAVKSLI